jgi:multiple sugar transport system ATP-binding protein
MSEVVLQQLCKRYGRVEAVRDVDLEISDGEFVVLVGPSGCGKSTTLKMVAGLEEITSGEILFNGQVVNDLTPKQRNIAMVFQSYALYPHMTVFNNMAFGLKLKRLPKAEVRRLVEEAARLLSISELLARKPRELSGGQRQRVAMGRAIVRQPLVFLFDEPLSNLDANLRSQMRVEIKKLHSKLSTTVIYVTHDQVEAMTLADRIVVMNEGRIVQVGDPLTVYNKPVSKFVAGFIGAPKMNFIPARLVNGGGDALAVELSEGVRLAVPQSRREAYAPMVDKEIELGLRPEDLTVDFVGDPSHVTFEAPIDVIEPLGAEALVFLSVNGAEVTAQCKSEDAARIGKSIRLRADMERMHLVDPSDGRVIQGSAI